MVGQLFVVESLFIKSVGSVVRIKSHHISKFTRREEEKYHGMQEEYYHLRMDPDVWKPE